MIIAIHACGKQNKTTPVPSETQNSLPTQNSHTNDSSSLENKNTQSSSMNPTTEDLKTSKHDTTIINHSSFNPNTLKSIQGTWTQVMTRSGENNIDEYYRPELCWMEEKYEMHISIEYSETENGNMAWKYITNDRIRRDHEIIKAHKEDSTGGYLLSVKLDQREEEASQTHEIRIVPVEGDIWYVEDAEAGDSTMITKNPKEYPVQACE